MTDYFEELWKTYPTDLCFGKKGAKKVAKQAWDKINPDEDEAKRILHATKIGAAHCRKDHKPDRWAFVSTYLNQGRYDDVLEYTGKPDKQITELKPCAVCGKPCHGPAYTMCTDCTYQFEADSWKTKRKETLEGLGLYTKGMSQSELAQACRQFLKEPSGNPLKSLKDL